MTEPVIPSINLATASDEDKLELTESGLETSQPSSASARITSGWPRAAARCSAVMSNCPRVAVQGNTQALTLSESLVSESLFWSQTLSYPEVTRIAAALL